MRRKVDLPQPDGPMSAVTRPACMVRETWLRTMWSPNQAVMFFASSSASGSAAPSMSVSVGAATLSPGWAPSACGSAPVESAGSGRSVTSAGPCPAAAGPVWEASEMSSSLVALHQVWQQKGHLVSYFDAQETEHGQRDDPRLPAVP